jgi:hypothetical protein
LCNCLSNNTLPRVKDRQRTINKKDIEDFAKEAAKGIKTPEDLNKFSECSKRLLLKQRLMLICQITLIMKSILTKPQ